MLLTAIVSILITLVVSLVYWLLLQKRKKEFIKTQNDARINSQRDIIEKRIYREEAKILEDSHNFVDTNKLLIKFASKSPFSKEIPNYSFFDELGINFSMIQHETNSAFCLMPFNNEFKSLYSTIKDACSSKNINCYRSDDSYEPGNLLKQIIISIIKSKFIFAMLDGRNPNVYYEIGLCHAMGKPVFLLAHNKQKDKLPFDVASSRLILYKSPNHLKDEIQSVISQYT